MRKFHKRYAFIVDKLSRLTDLRRKNVVDCASGVGDGSVHLFNRGSNVIGIDIDRKRIREGNKAFPDITFKCRSITDMGLPNNSVDIFVCSETLEHLTSKETAKAVAEINRVCKRNAYLCTTVPSDKKVCMKDKTHKQFIGMKAMKKYFETWTLISCDIFIKNMTKPNRGNRVMIFNRGETQHESIVA